MPLRSQDEIDAGRATFTGSCDPNEDIWLFGYGSLMWNPKSSTSTGRERWCGGVASAVLPVDLALAGSRAAPGTMMDSIAADPASGRLSVPPSLLRSGSQAPRRYSVPPMTSITYSWSSIVQV